MTRVRKIWLIVFGVAIFLFASVLLIVATDSGTRWVLDRAAGYLPKQLVLGDSQGSFLRGVRFSSIEWHSEAVQVSITNLYANIEFLPLFSRHVAFNELLADRVDIRILDTGEAEASGNLPTIELPVELSIASSSLKNVSYSSELFTRTAEEIRVAGHWHGTDLELQQLQFASTWLQLSLDGRVRLSDNYRGSIHAEWQWTESEALQIAGVLRMEGDLLRYELQHSLFAPVSVTTSGSLSYEAGNLVADLLHEWKSLDWAIGDRALHSPAGSLRLQGNATRFAVMLEASARLDDLPETSISLTGDADLESIQASQLVLINELGRVAANGDIRWLPEQAFDLSFTASDLDPSVLSDLIAGKLKADGRINGHLGVPSPNIDLQIARLGGNINGLPLQGNAGISYRGDTLTLADGHFQLGSNRVNAMGSIGESVSLNADFDVETIAEVLPEASGAVRGIVAINGARDRPDATLKLTGTALAWRDYALNSLSADVSLSATDPGFVELRLDKLTLGGTTVDSAHLSGSGQVDQHNVHATIGGYDSKLVIEATGGYSQGQWSGNVDTLAIANEILGQWSSHEPGALTASRDEVALSRTCLFGPSEPSRACLGGTYQMEGATSFDLSMTELPLAALPATLPADVNLSGFMDAHFRGEFADQHLNGDAGIELRQAKLDTTIDGEAISVVFSDTAGQATITANRVESSFRMAIADGAGTGNLELAVQDVTDRQSPITGRGAITIGDTSLFGILVSGISNPVGKIDGAMTISGSLNEPEFLGEVALTDGSFGVRQAGIEVSEMGVRLSQRAAGQLQLTGSARSGSGEISIQGDTRVSADTGFRTELLLTGENFELARLPSWHIEASPSISVVLDERRTSVTGELNLPTANIRLKEIPETAVSPSQDAIVHRPEGIQSSASRRIDINVRTSLGSNVQFSGFGLTTGLEGAVQLQGGTHAPYVGAGTLTLRDGSYKAYGQQLEIERGELIFNGPLDNPRLDIRAVRRTKDVVAGIQLFGTPSQLRSEVFSTPSLSDPEALSYLLTGQSLASAKSAGEGDTLNNAAFALGLSGAGSVTSRIRTELGLETLTVEGGAEDGKIIAGKRFGNRLLVEYGYGLIDKLGTLLLRYQLNDHIVLESRTGTVSNLDVVYSVKKK